MQNAVGMISNLRWGIRAKEGFEWILGMTLRFQEIECLIETLFRFTALSHPLLQGVFAQLFARMLWTRSKNWSSFKKLKFLCFTESRNNRRILLLLCCWYMAYIRKCLPENYWALCTCAQNSARPEQGSKLLSLLTLRSGWMSADISWGLQTSQNSQRDAVDLLCDSLMVNSLTQQVWGQICFSPGGLESLSHLSRSLYVQ